MFGMLVIEALGVIIGKNVVVIIIIIIINY